MINIEQTEAYPILINGLSELETQRFTKVTNYFLLVNEVQLNGDLETSILLTALSLKLCKYDIVSSIMNDRMFLSWAMGTFITNLKKLEKYQDDNLALACNAEFIMDLEETIINKLLKITKNYKK